MSGFKLFTLLAVAFTSTLASAESQYSSAYNSCVSKAQGVTSDIVSCDGLENDRQTVRMNKAFQLALESFSPDQQVTLREGQEAWVKYRELDCQMHYTLTGGTMDLINGSGCELSKTRDRADALEWFVKNGG